MYLQKDLTGGCAKTVMVIAYTPDGTRIVACHIEGTMNTWCASSGKLISSRRVNADAVCIAVSNEVVAIADKKGGIQLCHLDILDEQGDLLINLARDKFCPAEPNIFIKAMCYAGDDLVVARNNTGCDGWSVSKGIAHIATSDNQIKTIEKASGYKGRAIALSPDGSLIAVGGSDGNVQALSTDSGKMGYCPMIHRHRDLPMTVAFCPQNKTVFSSDKNSGVLWGLDWEAPLPCAIQADGIEHTSAVFSGDGRFLLTIQSNNVVVWDAATKKVLRSHAINKSSENFCTSFAASPDGKAFACSALGCRGKVLIFSLDEGLLVEFTVDDSWF